MFIYRKNEFFSSAVVTWCEKGKSFSLTQKHTKSIETTFTLCQFLLWAKAWGTGQLQSLTGASSSFFFVLHENTQKMYGNALSSHSQRPLWKKGFIKGPWREVRRYINQLTITPLLISCPRPLSSLGFVIPLAASIKFLRLVYWISQIEAGKQKWTVGRGLIVPQLFSFAYLYFSTTISPFQRW